MVILSLYVLFCSSCWCCLEMVTPRDVEWCGKRLGWIQWQHPRPWGRCHHLAKYVRKERCLISVEVLGSAYTGIYICVPVWAPWPWWPFQCVQGPTFVPCCSTKMYFLEENDNAFLFSHKHKHSLILTFKLK